MASISINDSFRRMREHVEEIRKLLYIRGKIDSAVKFLAVPQESSSPLSQELSKIGSKTLIFINQKIDSERVKWRQTFEAFEKMFVNHEYSCYDVVEVLKERDIVAQRIHETYRVYKVQQKLFSTITSRLVTENNIYKWYKSRLETRLEELGKLLEWYQDIYTRLEILYEYTFDPLCENIIKQYLTRYKQ